MATLLARIKVRPGCSAAFEAVAQELFRDSHAHDEGLLAYGYWRGRSPDTYYALLAYETFHAFLAHQSSDHHEAATPALRDLTEEIDLQWVDPVVGASQLPPTVVAPAPEGADALTVRYAQRFADAEAPWWPPRPAPGA